MELNYAGKQCHQTCPAHLENKKLTDHQTHSKTTEIKTKCIEMILGISANML